MQSIRNQINSYFAGWEPVEIASGVVLSMVVIHGVKYLVFNFSDVKNDVTNKFFSIAKSLPGVAEKVQEEKRKTKEMMATELNKHALNQEKILVLPAQGLSHDEIMKRMVELRDHEVHGWKSGKVSGAIYGNDDKHVELMNKAYALFSMTNPLHADLFPATRKFENEVLRMTAKMLRGNDDVCGVITSGGTESIIMAVKAHRDINPHIKYPEMIVPVTAHAAFDKAADLLRIKLIHLPMNEEGKPNLKDLKKAITKNTILIAGSAPNYPHGVVDPIPEMAAIAKEHGIGFHVDSCLGSFFMPWAREYSKGKIPDYDFQVPGVTSISCDTHKYGYATKGTSVVLFRNPELRHGMYFVQPNWPGGMYASPAIAGSRPGGLIACCWASLVAMGEDGYKRNALGIYDTVQEIKEGVKKISQLYVPYDTYSNVISFASKDLDIFQVSSAMSARGWHLNNLQRPACIHICVTAMHIGKASVFLQELADSVEEVVKNPEKYKKGSAALYGLAATIPDRSIIRDVGEMFLDVMLS